MSQWRVEPWEEESVGGAWPPGSGGSVSVQVMRRLHRRHTDARHRLAKERHWREGGASPPGSAEGGTGKAR